MTRLSLATVLMTFLGPISAGANSSCREAFTEKSEVRARQPKIDLAETITHWYTTIELGFHDKWIALDRVTGRRRMLLYESETSAGRRDIYEEVEIMPGAPDDGSSYYAQMMLNQRTGQMRTRLFPISANGQLALLLDQQFDMTWNTYRKANVVTENEIHQFKQTEFELANQRKINFATTTPDGRVLALMRVYDGSPFPALAFADYPTHHEAPETDPRLPIERRYPHLKLRKDSEYIFEAGRLAKSEELQDILKFQFRNFALYLTKKFGALGLMPEDFAHRGKVYVEITGRHLEHYLKPFANGGMGFTLIAKANREGDEMRAVKKGTTFRSLGRKDGDPTGKFVLDISVFDFVTQYFGEMKRLPPREAYPELFAGRSE